MANKREKKDLSLQGIIAKIQKQYGKDSVSVAADSKAASDYRRIETGVFAVDYATGGGFPHGMTTLLWGAFSGAKSTLALLGVASAQKMCREHVVKMVPTGKLLNRCSKCGRRSLDKNCPGQYCKDAPMKTKVDELACPVCKKHNPIKTIYGDLEGAFTVSWAAQLGVDCTILHLLQPEYGAQMTDQAAMLLESGEFDLLVIDSLAQMTPMTELEVTAEKNQMGLQAREVNKALRVFTALMNSSREGQRALTLILINQERQKIGVVYGDPATKPGGMMQDFVAAVTLKLRGASKPEQDDKGNTLGRKIHFEVKKNKTAPTAGQRGMFMLWTRNHGGRQAGSTDEETVLFEYGTKYGVIVKDKKGYVIDGTDYRTKTQADMIEMLSQDGPRTRVREKLMGMMLGEQKVWWEGDVPESGDDKSE